VSPRHFSVTRFGRLCMKEMRESLRDRRTVITLVLMPLLIYPLLSLVLNRVLLSGIAEKAKLQVNFGFSKEVSESAFGDLVTTGFAMLYDSERSPVFLEPVLKSSRNNLAITPESELAVLPEPKFLLIDHDATTMLKNGSVDLVVLKKSTTNKLTIEGKPLPATVLIPPRSVLQQTVLGEKLIDPERLKLALGDYEVHYRMNDPSSERALQILERTIASFNNMTTRRILGRDYEAPLRLRATPVSFPSNYSDMLATMVPLVLVLMTMAGAVYPAIDLTAGERERGTMEALVVSPTPNYMLLLAKYSAVVTVSLLTAIANLLAMTITLWASGMGKLIFGEAALSLGLIGQILALLILFTTFFSALLLAITSFARSFKEAQAYLIPVMLLALTPGVLSLLPGVRFTNTLATIPLVNIVLLARQVLTDAVEWNTATTAVICTSIYAGTALAIASRLFGSDASLQGSQGSWRDMIQRPESRADYPRPDQMAMTMAVLFPLYFVASSVLPSTSKFLETRLAIATAVSFALILGLPVLVAWYRKLNFATTFRLQRGTFQQWKFWFPAMLLLGLTTWTVAHEIFYYSQMVIGSIDSSRLSEVAKFANQLRELPLPFVLFVFAITPAICEEFFFRGFVLGSLSRYSNWFAILVSAALFGVMHVLTSNVLMVERFLPTTFIGILLGWIALSTGSLWPGILFHMLHNGLQFALNHYRDVLAKWDYAVEENSHLPTNWLILGVIGMVLGIGLLAIVKEKKG
jgi:sodium transport system permease protein